MELTNKLGQLFDDVKETLENDKYTLSELEDGFIRAIEHAEELESNSNTDKITEEQIIKRLEKYSDTYNIRKLFTDTIQADQLRKQIAQEIIFLFNPTVKDIP